MLICFSTNFYSPVIDTLFDSVMPLRLLRAAAFFAGGFQLPYFDMRLQ